MIGRSPKPLNFYIVQTGAVGSLANSVHLWRLLEFQVDQGPALEIHTQRQSMPKEHGQQARNAENQREAEKIPLLSQPVDIYFMKKFHAALPILAKNLFGFFGGPVSEIRLPGLQAKISCPTVRDSIPSSAGNSNAAQQVRSAGQTEPGLSH
jgi:hypothetical protein